MQNKIPFLNQLAQTSTPILKKLIFFNHSVEIYIDWPAGGYWGFVRYVWYLVAPMTESSFLDYIIMVSTVWKNFLTLLNQQKNFHILQRKAYIIKFS